MSLTLFLNTFCSSTRVKWGISRKYNDTALSRWPSSLCGESILSLASQNTLTKTPVRHFPITYEAVTNTFMLNTNHRNTPQPFSRPYTSINLRYATTCKFQMALQLGLITHDHVSLNVLENSLGNILYLSDFCIYYCSHTLLFTHNEIRNRP